LYQNLSKKSPELMPDDLHKIEQNLLKALKEHKKKPPKDKQPPNTYIPAVIASVL